MVGKPAGAQAAPALATMGLISGTLELHRVATVLSSGQHPASEGYAVIGDEFRTQQHEHWQLRLNSLKDQVEKALVQRVLHDLNDPTWNPVAARPKAEF